jgi:hypothetical protein
MRTTPDAERKGKWRMLSVNSYTKEYIDDCRAKVDRQLSTYARLIATTRKQAGAGNAALESAIDSFEPNFFNHMILALDNYFLHRSRMMELKDGNPLNEVRVLCNSITTNDGKLCADKTIKLDPAKSILGFKVGDEIRLNTDSFTTLSKAYFGEIERKYR